MGSDADTAESAFGDIGWLVALGSGRCPEGFIALVPLPEGDWNKGSALGWYHGVM